MGYKGHKSQWGRDTGNVHGHPTKHPALHQHSQPHTDFQARGFHADKGSNCSAEGYHTNMTNRRKHDPDAIGPNRSHSSHDPRPEHYHKNSGTDGDGHQVMRRGGSVYRSHRGMK